MGPSHDSGHPGGGWLGGSASLWPLHNQRYPADQRKYLSFWGSDNENGGCCSWKIDHYNDGFGHPFSMHSCTSADISTSKATLSLGEASYDVQRDVDVLDNPDMDVVAV